MKRITLFIFCLFFLFSTTIAQSQEAPVDSTVVDSVVKKEPVTQREPAVFPLSVLSFDSTIIAGSNYGCIGDVLDWLPGTCHFDRGSIGQLSLVSLFSGIEGRTLVGYDGLILNDPLTGYSDLNLVPTENVGEIEISVASMNRQYGFLQSGPRLHFRSRNLADLPVKSRVGYRNGQNAFDDIDVRLGIKASPVLQINAGGILKNYGGTMDHSTYRGQKINLKINRRLTENWQLAYLLLFNKFDLDIPEPQPVQGLGIRLEPHQKDVRYDHLLSFTRNQQFYTTIQYTDLYREYIGNQRLILNEVHEAGQLLWTAGYRRKIKSVSFHSGMNWGITSLESTDWGEHHDWRLGGWTHIAGAFNQKFLWQAGGYIEKQNEYDISLKPEINFIYKPGKETNYSLWFNQQVYQPGLEARYSNGPYVQGLETLKQEKMNQIGLSCKRSLQKLELFAAGTMTAISDQIGVVYIPGEDDTPMFRNVNNQTRYAFDISAEYKLSDLFQIGMKGRYLGFEMKDTDMHLLNIPGYYGKGFIQFAKSYFKGDLDARIRITGALYGDTSSTGVYYAQFSSLYTNSSTAFVPSVHGIFVIKDATVFVSIENPLSIDYSVVAGYLMPKTQFRWGFMWNFTD